MMADVPARGRESFQLVAVTGRESEDAEAVRHAVGEGVVPLPSGFVVRPPACDPALDEYDAPDVMTPRLADKQSRKCPECFDGGGGESE